MSDYVIYSTPTGEIIGSLATNAEPDLDTEGVAWVEGRGSSATHYIMDGALTEYTYEQREAKAKHPGYPARWSNLALAWEALGGDPLPSLKSRKLLEIKTSRDQALQAFTWDGSIFDADTDAKINLTGAISRLTRKGGTAMWRLADNSWRELTLSELQQVLEALEDNVEHCFQRFAYLEALVAASKTPEQLDSINWTN